MIQKWDGDARGVRLLLGCGLAALVASGPCETSRNMVANPGFEVASPSGPLPREWTTYVPAEGPFVGLSSDQKHEGLHSACIRTDDDRKAYLVSNLIPVVPGEILSLSVWCRTQDMATTSAGSYGINCGFLDRDRRYLSVAKWEALPVCDRIWFLARSEAEVPPKAAYATFQVGHRLMSGTSWWDEAELVTSKPLAVRFDLQDSTGGPGPTTLPLVVLNRMVDDGTSTILLETMPGNISTQVEVGGRVEIPCDGLFRLDRRGKRTLTATLKSIEGSILASTRQDMTVPPLLFTEPPLPIYFCVEDGRPRLEGRVWINEDARLRSGLSLECSLHSASQTTAVPGLARCLIPAPLPPNPVDFSLETSESLPRGDYTLLLQVKRKQHVQMSATEAWHVTSRQESMVSIGPDGFLRVGGKPFFPIGMFDCTNYEEIAGAGFNVTQNYDVGHVRPGSRPDNRRMLRILDNSLKNGMKHLFLVCHGPGSRNLNAEHLRRLRMFRDHPAVLCWFEEEGVARGDVTIDFLREFYSKVHEIAPEHPVVIGDSVDRITRVTDRSMFFPTDCMDIGFWWWYPFPIRKGGRPAAYEGEEEARGLELVPPSFLTLAKTSKPIWVSLQSYRKPTGFGRFPTVAEYRAQAYIAVIHGARGLFYYTGSGTGGVQNAREAGHWNYLKELASELRAMAPVFLSGDCKLKVDCEPSSAMSWRLKENGNDIYLMAANRSDQPVDIDFWVPFLTETDSVKVRFEARQVKAVQTGFRDRFDGYGVHVYILPRPGSARR